MTDDQAERVRQAIAMLGIATPLIEDLQARFDALHAAWQDFVCLRAANNGSIEAANRIIAAETAVVKRKTEFETLFKQVAGGRSMASQILAMVVIVYRSPDSDR